MFRLLVIGGLFFVTVFILSLGLSREIRNRYVSDERSNTVSVGTANTTALEMQLERSLGTTLALAASIRNGERQLLENFDAIAQDLIATYGSVDNLQLAPDGVVSYIYPLEGNEEAIGHDLLNDPARRAEALKTIESRDLTLAGPFELVQGGTAIIGRYPVFLSDESGVDRFWGFTVALIHLSPLLDVVGFPNLIESHEYELSRIPPDTGSRQVFARSSATSIRDGAAIDVAAPNATWTLTLIPKSGWVPTWLGVLLFVGPLAIAVGSSALFLAYLVQRQKKRGAEESIIALNKELEQRIRHRQHIINQAPDAMFISRVDNFMVTEVNDRACDRYGYSRQEFLTMNIFDIEVEPPLKQAVRDIYDGTPIGEVVEVYGTNRTKDGNTFPVHVRFAKLDDAFAVATVRDITEQRKNEEKLRDVDRHLREQAEQLLAESEARFHQVAENLTTALSLKGSDGNEILYANRAWLEIWGTKDPQERLQLVHPDDRELLELVVRQREDGLRDSVVLEYRIVLEDGDIRWIEAQSIPILNSRGEIYRWAGVNTDITERKKAEEALRESEELHRAVLESLNDAIVVRHGEYNSGGKRVYANSAFRRMHGIGDDADISVVEVQDWVLPEDRELVVKHREARMRGDLGSAGRIPSPAA